MRLGLSLASNGTKSSVEITDAIKALLDSQAELLGVKHVYYGRTAKIPDYPAICVESGPKDRTLAGGGSTRRFALNLTTDIYVYFGEVASAERTMRENELLTENVEDVLHTDFGMADTVIFGFVTRVEPGVAIRSEVMIKVSRLTWTGISRQDF